MQNLADPEVYHVGNTWMLFYEMEALGERVRPVWARAGISAWRFPQTARTWEPYGGAILYDPPNPPTDFPANGNPVVKPTAAFEQLPLRGNGRCIQRWHVPYVADGH